MAWGPTNFHTEIFQLERHRLKIDEKIIDSLSNLHLSIQCIFPYLLCKFHIVPPKVHMENPEFFVPLWRMSLSLLCFGHVAGIVICEVDRKKLTGSYSGPISSKLVACSGYVHRYNTSHQRQKHGGQTKNTADRRIWLSTLRPVANDLLNDALRLDNELSALAATCSLRSVSKVQINHLGLQNPFYNRKIPWRVS